MNKGRLGLTALLAVLLVFFTFAGAAADRAARDVSSGKAPWSVRFIYGENEAVAGGGESAYLSGILAALEIDTGTEDILSAVFSDGSAVSVEKAGRDWRLDMLRPFDRPETLTLTLKSGESLVISAIDPPGQTYYSDLTEMVKAVSITGAEVSGTTWTVRPDTPYEITVVFQETGHKQFDMDTVPFTYQLPEGLVLEAQSGTDYIAFKYNRPGEEEKTYRVPFTYSIAADGSVEITPEYEAFLESLGDMPDLEKRAILDSLKRGTDLRIELTLSGKFGEEDTTLEWGSQVTTDVIVDLEEKHDLFIEKTADYGRGDGYVYYTLKVTSEGDNETIEVRDTISGNALIFEGVSGITGTGDSTCLPKEVEGATFAYAIDHMTDGQVIEISYRARIDYGADSDHDGQLTFDQTRNTAALSGDDTDDKQVTHGNVIQFSSVRKGSGQVVGVDETEQTQTVSWSVEVNPEAMISVGGSALTDRISGDSLPMHYSGDGITVQVYDAAGRLLETRDVSWGEMGVDKETARSYTYTFPQGDGKWRYVVTYTTDVDVSGLSGTTAVSNTVEGEHGTSTGSTGITWQAEDLPTVSKRAVGYSLEEVTWEVTVHVPADGLAEQYGKLTDQVPFTWYEAIQYWDEYIDGSVQVSGLLPQSGDTYTVSRGTHGFDILFKKSDGSAGLTGIGAAYDVYVTFRTKNNEDWLKLAEESGNPWYRDHTNQVRLDTITATATETIASPFVDKRLVSGSIVTVNGVRYLEFDIVIGGITTSDTLATVRDVFDTAVFRVPTDAEIAASDNTLQDQFRIFGGSQYDQRTPAGTAVCSNVEDGIEIVVTDIPDDPQTHDNYSFLRIHYWLALKDDVDLDHLAQSSEGGVWKTSNRAVWNDVEDEATFEHKYVYLDKELLNEDEIDDEHRTAKYRITYNPQQGRINNGEDIILTDTWSSTLNIDYATITITTVPESAAPYVRYTISGYTATYTIPDQTAVTIEYEAKVIGTGEVRINNTATDGRLTVKTKADYTFDSGSHGSGSSVSFTVVKADGNNNGIRIPHVRFKLTAPQGYPLLDEGEVYEVILETNEKGEVYFQTSQYNIYYYDYGDGFIEGDPSTYLSYTLTEMDPPAGYEALDRPYVLSFTNDPSKVSFDGGSYIYYRTGSMQIKNWPLEGLTVKKKTVSSQSGDKTREFHFTITLDDTSVNGTFGNVDEEGRYDGHEITFTGGVASFSLKDGEYRQAVGLPAGIGYTIEETGADGFTTVSSDRTTSGGAVFSGTTEIEGTEVTFVNTRAVTLTGTKILEGRELLDGDIWTYTLTDSSGKEIAAVTNTLGTYVFAGFTFTMEDLGGLASRIITCYIVESGEVAGVINDGDLSREIKILLERDGEYLAAAVLETEDLTFVNDYSATGSIVFRGSKILSGRSLDEGEFTFTLSEDGTVIRTAVNGEGGAIVFEPVLYTLEDVGTHTYVVKEEVPEGVTEDEPALDGIVYDLGSFTVTVRVTDNGDGTLKAEIVSVTAN